MNYESPYFRENIAELQGYRKARQVNRNNKSPGYILLGEEIAMIGVIYLKVPVHEKEPDILGWLTWFLASRCRLCPLGRCHLCSSTIRDDCRATAEPWIQGSWTEKTRDSSLLGCEDLREDRRVICPFLSQGTNWRQEWRR